MTDSPRIVFELRKLSNMIRRKLDEERPEEDKAITGLQGFTIGYLARNRDRDVFQRDIEKQFNVRRSSVTGLLKLMEKNGLVTRESVGHDARLKKLALTEKALEHHNRIMAYFDACEKQIRTGLSEEEARVFFDVLRKIEKNLGPEKKEE